MKSKIFELMTSVWGWVGLVLFVYGVIIFGAGVYYIFNPDKTKAMWYINPSLWWGAFMLAFGLLLLIFSKTKKGKRS